MSSVLFPSPELSLPRQQPPQTESKEQGCCRTAQTLIGACRALSLEAVVKDLTEGGCFSLNLSPEQLFLQAPQIANSALLRGHQGKVVTTRYSWYFGIGFTLL